MHKKITSLFILLGTVTPNQGFSNNRRFGVYPSTIEKAIESEKEDTSLIDELNQVDNNVDVELLETNRDSSSRATREDEDGEVDRSCANSGTMSKERARQVEMSSTQTPQPAQTRPFDSCESKTVGLGKGTYF